eukprot:15457207-Alexandrium_andersonii.AAC.1
MEGYPDCLSSVAFGGNDGGAMSPAGSGAGTSSMDLFTSSQSCNRASTHAASLSVATPRDDAEALSSHTAMLTTLQVQTRLLPEAWVKQLCRIAAKA